MKEYADVAPLIHGDLESVLKAARQKLSLGQGDPALGGRVFVLPPLYIHRLRRGNGIWETWAELRLQLRRGPRLYPIAAEMGSENERAGIDWRLGLGRIGSLTRGCAPWPTDGGDELSFVDQLIFDHSADWPPGFDSMDADEWDMDREGGSYERVYGLSLDQARRLSEIYGTAMFSKLPLFSNKHHGLGCLAIHTFAGHHVDRGICQQILDDVMTSYAQTIAKRITIALGYS